MPTPATILSTPLHRFPRAILLGALFASCLARGGEPPTEPVLELPKFTVSERQELPPPESWHYATTPGFEILSNDSDRATRRLIKDFEMFQVALGIVWPINARPAAPISLIVCGHGGKFAAFGPPGEVPTPDNARVSLFLQNHGRAAIIVDQETKVLNVCSAGAAAKSNFNFSTSTQTLMPDVEDTTRLMVDHHKQVYREFVHYLLNQGDSRWPAWFEEGLVQIFMKMKVEKHFIEVGDVEDPTLISAMSGLLRQMDESAKGSPRVPDPLPSRGVSAVSFKPEDTSGGGLEPVEDGDFSRALEYRSLLSLEKLFAVAPDSPAARNVLGDNLWSKESYAFVHLCLYGRYDLQGRLHNDKTGPLPLQQPLADFLARAAKAPVTEAMFRDCFHIGYKDMEALLASYIKSTAYRSQQYRIKGEGIPDPEPLPLRDATQAEVGRIKGEALILAGRPGEARNEFVTAYLRGERDPELLASLGLFEESAGETEHAQKLLAAAVTSKTIRPEAYIELARFRYADALAKPGAGGGKLSAAQTDGVISLLLQARKLPPRLPALYELTADTWLHSAGKPKRTDVFPLIEGAQLYPDNLELVYQAAAFSAQAGIPEAAHPLAEHGLRYATDQMTRNRFAELNASLPPLPSAAPVPVGKP